MSKSRAANVARAGFRGDINGLRAWAVLPVLLYHFGVPGFSGGFVGVDVFFVISGFLMAGIVVGGLQRQRFNLADFYLARARRTLPALLVLVAVLLVVGWFLLMPHEYRALGKHARDSVLFVSNLRYMGEAGYFDTSSLEKWLLHTWSLSIEWQFYLLYPLLLMVLFRFRVERNLLMPLHVLFFAVSLVTCLLLSQKNQSEAFFLLYSRAWELLAGSLVYFLGRPLARRYAVALELLGFALIIGSFVMIDTATVWPGGAALVPVLGTVLVLLAKRNDSHLTANRFAQWVGIRSYSLYLWHWPLVVALVYFELDDAVLWVCLGLAASILFGHLSYVGIEVPTRSALSNIGRVRGCICLLVCVLLVACAAQLVRKSGFPDRLPEAVARVEAERDNRNMRGRECFGAEAECVYGGADVQALVLGDSHANALVTAAAASLPHPGQGIYFKGVPACLMVFQAQAVEQDQREECMALKKKLSEQLRGLYPGKPLIVINRTSYYAMGELHFSGARNPGRPAVYFSEPVEKPTAEFLSEFRLHYVRSVCQMAAAHPVYLVRPIPEMPAMVPLALGRAMLLGRPGHVAISREAYDERNRFIWSVQDEAVERCGVRILDPLPYLCDEQYCHGSRDGWPLYSDDDHLSEFGNRLLVPMFASVFSTAPADTAATSSESLLK